MSQTEPEPPSKAELIAEHINKQLDAKVDLTTLAGRKKDFVELGKNNPKLTFTKPHYLDILKREIKKRNMDAKAFGLTSKTPTFVRKTSDMKTTLEAHPSKVTEKQPKSKDTTEIAKIETSTTANQEEIRDVMDEVRINYTEKNVAVSIKAVYNVLKIRYPEIDDLTEEEKEILGELWLPAFQKYFADKYFILIVPMLSTLTLISPKIQKAKKKAKTWTGKDYENEIQKLKDKKTKLESK